MNGTWGTWIRLTAAAGVVAAAGYTAGCGRGGGKTAGGSGDGESIELEWWTFTEENGDIRVMREVIAELQKRDPTLPEIRLNVVQLGFENLYQKLLTVIAGGGENAPDLVDVEISQAGKFYKQEPIGFMDLTDRIRGSEFYPDQVAARMSPYTYKGRIYGIDAGITPSMMYYRKDLFDRYGIQAPFDTWDDYIEAGLELKKHGIAMVQLPNGANPQNFNEDLVPQLLFQQGGGYFDKDGNVIVNNEIGVQTIELLRAMVHEQGVATATITDIFDPPFYAPYLQDKVATILMPSWMLQFFMKTNMPDQAGKWRIAPLPAWEEGGCRTSTAGGTALMITRFTKHPELAWRVFEMSRMSPEGGRLQNRIMGGFPPVRSVLKDPEILRPDAYLGGQSMGEFFQEYAEEIPEYFMSPYWADAHELMAKEVLFPVLGENRLGAKEALDNMAAELERRMRAGGGGS